MIPFSYVGPEDRFDHWHEVTCRNFSHTECRAIPDDCFTATVDAQPFDSLVFSDIFNESLHTFARMATKNFFYGSAAKGQPCSSSKVEPSRWGRARLC